MRSPAFALAVGLALGSASARAEDAAAPIVAPAEGLAPAPLKHVGLLLDGGFPEGGAASLVFRPASQVRFWAGPAWNYIGFGVQGGMMLVPWQMGISPLVSVEVGRCFDADATFLAKGSGGVPTEIEPLLKHVGYDYAAAHVGFEVGTKNGFGMSLRAGLAYVSLVAKGTATTTDSGSGTVVAFTDPHLRGTVPSVKLGFQLWF